MSQENPTCPTDCGSFLPEVDFNYCDPNIEFGEIDKVYIMARDGGAFLDWESLSEWTARLALDPLTEINAIVELHVIGDQPVPESDEIIISLDRKIQTPKTFMLNVEIDDVSDANYQLMRFFECNTSVRMWYSANDVLFGNNEGIDGVNIKLGYQIERGQKVLQKIVGTVSWEGEFSPNRITNPMA